MYYSGIKKNDISNGPGIRTSIYVSGCRNCCKGCFNPETWNFKYGKLFDEEVLEDFIDASLQNHIEGITILGGEPFEPENQETVLNIILKFKEKNKDKSIWMFTGYLFDDHIEKWCTELPYTKGIIDNIDVLVDGKFDEALKDLELGFRGSSNQRIIDVKKSLKEGYIVLHEKQNSKQEKKIWK